MSVDNSGDLSNLLQQQTALAKFGELALKSDDLDEILTEACRLVGDALHTDLAKVMELQEDGETLLVRAGVGWNEGVVGQITIKAADNTSEGLALKTGEPMISHNIATEKRFAYPQFLIDNGVQAVANVVIIGGQGKPPFGILQIDSRRPREFTDNDTTFLRSYANLLAAAVDRLLVIGEMRGGKERLSLALVAGELGSWELNLATGTMTCTPRYEQIFGYTDPPPAWNYDSFLEHVLPEDRKLVADAYRHAAVTGTELHIECRIRRANDDEVRWIEGRGRPDDALGHARPAHLVGILADVTARKATEEALHESQERLAGRVQAQLAQQESEARFRFAAQAGHLGIWELDLLTLELTASAMCKDNFGRDQGIPFTYKELRDAAHPDDRDRMLAALDHSISTNTEYAIEHRIVRSDGATGWVQLHAQVLFATNGIAVRLAGISLDITKRVRTEERIRHSQSVEAVGRLTAGVAHDFNNVLQALQGGLELALDEIVGQPAVRADLELALLSVQHGARLTSHLLSFSRQQVLRPVALELGPLLIQLCRTLERTLGHDISVSIEGAPDLPRVLADASHLESALLNLALNARHAMPRGGELRIKASARPSQVVIAVIDTGEGMTPEVQARACEPFFSTKGKDGSGLGLSMVQGFARQSGGELHIQSMPGQGTRIEIWLPVAQADLDAVTAAPVAQQAQGDGSVLVVDDDTNVGQVTVAFLRKAGFDVHMAGDGNEALAKLGSGQTFDALVTDYAMPGMNGADLVLYARELYPALPALVITGYAGAEGLNLLPSDVATLRKPFQRAELVRMVKNLIEAAIFASPPEVR